MNLNFGAKSMTIISSLCSLIYVGFNKKDTLKQIATYPQSSKSVIQGQIIFWLVKLHIESIIYLDIVAEPVWD